MRAARAALRGPRVALRPLVEADYDTWLEVWRRNRYRLDPVGTFPIESADGTFSRKLFDEKLELQRTTHQLFMSCAFGVWAGDELVGEIGLTGTLQADCNALVTLWIDEARAGERLAAESFVLLLQHGFETMGLHRVESAVLPENAPVRRALDVTGVRNEGLAERYLKVAGEWRDHLRYAITTEEWCIRRADLIGRWAGPAS